jgi:hypothetical protein
MDILTSAPTIGAGAPIVPASAGGSASAGERVRFALLLALVLAAARAVDPRRLDLWSRRGRRFGFRSCRRPDDEVRLLASRGRRRDVGSDGARRWGDALEARHGLAARRGRGWRRWWNGQCWRWLA